MRLYRTMSVLALVAFSAVGSMPAQDPVAKVKAERAAQGSGGDLPPVPRAVLEPPPLPPPEAYERKASKKSVRLAKASVVKGGKSTKAAKAGASGKVAKAGKKGSSKTAGKKVTAPKGTKRSKKRK